MNVVGKTEDGREVVSGLFKLYDTHGLPLAIMFDELIANGKQPSFLEFVNEGLTAGWKMKTIITRLEEGVIDCYGRKYWDVVASKLEMVFGVECTK